MDNAARTRQRVLAIFLPVTAVLYISAEALSPKGTDQVISTTATALKVLPIAARHPAQLYLAGSLALLGLGGLAVSYAAIAALGSSPARHSARSSRTTAHLPPKPDPQPRGTPPMARIHTAARPAVRLAAWRPLRAPLALALALAAPATSRLGALTTGLRGTGTAISFPDGFVTALTGGTP